MSKQWFYAFVWCTNCSKQRDLKSQQSFSHLFTTAIEMWQNNFDPISLQSFHIDIYCYHIVNTNVCKCVRGIALYLLFALPQ